MKATPETNNAPKQPIEGREIFAWLLVTALAFGTAGVITGWFIHANVVSQNASTVASVSKDQGR